MGMAKAVVFTAFALSPFISPVKIKSMIKLKMYVLSISSVLKRFYLMMAIVIIFGYLNQWILAAVLAMIVAFSAMAGVSVRKAKPMQSSIGKKNNNVIPVETKPTTEEMSEVII